MIHKVLPHAGQINTTFDVEAIQCSLWSQTRAHENWRAAVCACSDDDFFPGLIFNGLAMLGDCADTSGAQLAGTVGKQDTVNRYLSLDGNVVPLVAFSDKIRRR